jgi:hypothetical protein
VTLELSRLAGQVRAMGQQLATRERDYADLVAQAREWLAQYAGRGEPLRHPAREFHAAIPTDEPLDAEFPLPAIPERFTFIAADGTEIQPDSHEIAYYYLINVGCLVYRHGSDRTPEAHSLPTIGYAEDDIYDRGRLVSGNLLDVKRDLAEITALADLCAAELSGAATAATPTIGVVDGTLILWTLRDTLPEYQREKAQAYIQQLDRIRDSGAVVAAFISRPRRSEVTRLLYLASVDGDLKQADEERNPLHHLADCAVFEMLAPGARSALFVSPSSINYDYYEKEGHTIHFLYLNVAEEGGAPAIARIEVPAWVTEDADRLALVHGAIVAQARITGDYPYALIRADELAFISGPEREAFEDMVVASLVRAGMHAALSPKKYYKTLTRQGKRKFR